MSGSCSIICRWRSVSTAWAASSGWVSPVRRSTATKRSVPRLSRSFMRQPKRWPSSVRSTLLQWVAQVLPATHFIAISRGIVIRGAGFLDLWQHVAALLAIATVLVLGSARAFRKTVS